MYINKYISAYIGTKHLRKYTQRRGDNGSLRQRELEVETEMIRRLNIYNFRYALNFEPCRRSPCYYHQCQQYSKNSQPTIGL